jgi:hypothetical protein
MKAELHWIQPNNRKCNWESFEADSSIDPWDDYGSFSLSIGPEGDPGSTYFQVLVSTPAAAGRARESKKFFRGILVESFERTVIENTLREFVQSRNGIDWQDLVDQLRTVMDWEYDGMGQPASE